MFWHALLPEIFKILPEIFKILELIYCRLQSPLERDEKDNRRLNLAAQRIAAHLAKFSDGGGVSICQFCGRAGLPRKQRNWERERDRDSYSVYGVATSGRVGVEDGQEAKELPQGGSLRDNVDTSVTVKRTFSGWNLIQMVWAGRPKPALNMVQDRPGAGGAAAGFPRMQAGSDR
jgi:hypothetical protein